MLPTHYKALILAAVAAAGGFYYGYQWQDRAWGAKWAQAEADAAKALIAATEKNAHTERLLIAAKDNREILDNENQKIVAVLERKLLNTRRLRDPHATPCSVPATSTTPASASDSIPDTANAAGVVSAELAGLLFDLARRADEINIAYDSCREYSIMAIKTMRSGQSVD